MSFDAASQRYQQQQEEERRRRLASGSIGSIGGGPQSRPRNAKEMLLGQGLASGDFANRGQQGYGDMTAEMAQQRQFLMDLASGKHSVSAEQLRQGMQQNIAGQQSMAAGARPANAAMAARTAMMNSGRIGSGLAGQTALAGLMERQQAQQALAQLNLGQRGQDLQAALGSRGNAINAYGNVLGQPKGPSTAESAAQTAAMVAAAAAMFSDRRLKEDIKPGKDKARAALDQLAAYSYRYKDDKHGKGEQFGIMAQDLEKAGLKHAVIDTPAGKMVHGAKLAASNTGMLAALSRRVSELEGKGK